MKVPTKLYDFAAVAFAGCLYLAVLWDILKEHLR